MPTVHLYACCLLRNMAQLGLLLDHIESNKPEHPSALSLGFRVLGVHLQALARVPLTACNLNEILLVFLGTQYP